MKSQKVIAVISIVLTLAAFLVSIYQAMVTGDYANLVTHAIFLGPVAIAFVILGMLVASRQPNNPIGWIFLIEGLFYTLTLVFGIYSDLGSLLSTGGFPPGSATVSWISSWIWVPSILLPTIFLFLLFPNGRLPSPRWRPVFWSAVLGLILFTISQALSHEPYDGPGALEGNPFGLVEPTPALGLLHFFASTFTLIGLTSAILAFGIRFRRSQAEERNQMKWMAYSLVMMVIFLILGTILFTFLPQSAMLTDLLISFTNLVILGIAVGAGIAILRYRLYDIDFIINRTLVYGTMTITVAILYGIVVSVTGYFIQTDNNFAGLLFTVAIVTLFRKPIHHSLQQAANRVVTPKSQPLSLIIESEYVKNDSNIEHSERIPQKRSQVLLGVLVLFLIGLAFAYTGLHLVRPFDNGRLQPGSNAITAEGLLVTPLEGGPEGFKAGDLVTAVEGRPVEEWLATAAPDWSIGEIVDYTIIRDGVPMEVEVTLGRYPLDQILVGEWGMMVFRFAYLIIAAYVFLRRPDAIPSRLLLLAAATQVNSSTWSIGAQVSDFIGGLGIWLYHGTTIIGFILTWIASFHFALVFPKPLPFLERNRRLVPLMYITPYLLLAGYLTWTGLRAANVLDWMSYWGPPTGLFAAVFLILTILAVIRQYSHHKSGIARQQIRWVAFAAILVGGFAVLFYFIPPFLNLETLDRNLIGVVGVLFPSALAIAILRHNLFDIDILINRTLVYGGLTAIILSLYVLIVGILGTILQAQGNLLIALTATGLAAILFQPIRERLQKTVNRFMYGERDEPFEVLARLGQRLEATLTPEMVYPTIVETVSQALKLPYVAVAVWRNGQWETAESYGKPVSEPIIYPLTHQGEMVGRLLVAQRAAEEPFSPADERILLNIARQGGAAVYAVQLVADLQQSRQQLVTAREEERRRLRRDLHDGLGPQLASQTLTIDAIDKLISRDPERARALLQDLKNQSKAAVQDIRRLVYNLRPPALDELGLVGALRDGASRQSQNGFQVTVDALSPLPPLPAAVEVAVYRIAQEAVTNAVRHAGATICTVQLMLENHGSSESLCLEVRDNGRGLPVDSHSGVGLQSMRERASELGGSCRIESLAAGGVCVSAVFPLPDPKNKTG